MTVRKDEKAMRATWAREREAWLKAAALGQTGTLMEQFKAYMELDFRFLGAPGTARPGTECVEIDDLASALFELAKKFYEGDNG